MTGFFEEAPGIRSMTRLLAFLAALGACAGLMTCCWVAVAAMQDATGVLGGQAPGIIAALAAAAAAAFAGVWSVLKERTSANDA